MQRGRVRPAPHDRGIAHPIGAVPAEARLELAEVYVDVGKYSKAREQLSALATLPIADVLDHTYQHNAAQLLEDIKGEKDET
ncbi:MAG: hypothetical protein AUH12_00160 [Gemmatimonadetes bacterium 13_2_20CM_69_8]|nr:MAG: hypothetical protein AUH12_00160 [Gemmatimonadetes bacterium 13_2_20CM_69_8]